MRPDLGARQPVQDVQNDQPLLPVFSSESEYEAALPLFDPWLPAIRAICKRLGIAPMSSIRSGLSETFPTAIIPPRHVLKLFGPWFQGPACFEAELRAHSLMAADIGLPVPMALAHGAIDEGWAYLVTSFVPGVTLASVRAGLLADDMLLVADWLGRFEHRLRGLALSGPDRAEAQRRWQEAMSYRHRNAPTALGARETLPAWVAHDVEAWLPSIEDLLPADDWTVLLHADLHDEHVLGEMSNGRFEPRFVIDFDRSQVGHPYYELGPLVRWTFRGDPALTAAFVSAAGLARPAGMSFARLALAYVLLHDADMLSGLPALDQSSNLDDLARVLFGPD